MQYNKFTIKGYLRYATKGLIKDNFIENSLGQYSLYQFIIALFKCALFINLGLSVISQLILPICLALMMFSIGLSLTIADFKRVLLFPKAILLGVSLQLIALPLIAWGIILGLQHFSEMAVISAIGLLIIAACPGGATSNIIAHLSGANAALSVTLTGLISFITPFILPITLSWQLNIISDKDMLVEIPVFNTWLPLIIVSILPITLGMYLRKNYRQWSQTNQPRISTLSALLLLALICILVTQQWSQIQQQAWQVFYSCGLLCILALALSNLTARWLHCDARTQKTLAIETSIQNAGTGIFIAVSVLQQPELALLPLSYGLLMNIPALLFITQGYYQRRLTPLSNNN